MATEAPVCHLPPVVDIPQPAPTVMPSIPPATLDPSSMLAAIQALTAGFQLLTGQQQQRGGAPGQDGQPGQSAKSKKGDWQEQSRRTAKVRVTNPQDETQFVDVQVINQLVMVNATTGETWVWNR